MSTVQFHHGANLPENEISEVVEVESGKRSVDKPCSEVLLQGDTLQATRLMLPAGRSTPAHSLVGETTIHCLRGAIAVETEHDQRTLEAGELTSLAPHCTHLIRAMDDSEVLITCAEPVAAEANDAVDESSQDSFPASDAPSWTPVTSSKPIEPC